MTHPQLQEMRRLAGLPVMEASTSPYARQFAGKSQVELNRHRKYLNSVLSEVHKESPKFKQTTEELAALEDACKTLKEANEAIIAEANKFNFEKKEDDKDAKKDDKKEEKKADSEKKKDDEDADKDDKKEEKKFNFEKKLDDKDAEKDDKKEESKKKKDDKEADKDDKKEEKKEKAEKKLDDKDAKKDDKKEALKESDHLEDALSVAKRLLAGSSYLDYLPPGTREDTKYTELETLGDLTLPTGYGLKKHNETGFKPLSTPSNEHPKEDMLDSDIENKGKADFGLKEAVDSKVVMPKDVKKAIEDRIKELHEAIELEDGKGYNDTSVRQNAIDALTQILQNTSDGTEEGVKESQIFVGTLMSPITNLLPQQLFNWLGTALNVKTVKESTYNRDFQPDDRVGHERAEKILDKLEELLQFANPADKEANSKIHAWVQTNVGKAFWDAAADLLYDLGFDSAAGAIEENSFESGY